MLKQDVEENMEEPLEPAQEPNQETLSLQQQLDQCLDRWSQEGNFDIVQLANILTRQAQLTTQISVEAQQAPSDQVRNSTLTKQQIQAIVKRVSELTISLERLSRTVIQQDKQIKRNTQQIAALALLVACVLFLQLLKGWR